MTQGKTPWMFTLHTIVFIISLQVSPTVSQHQSRLVSALFDNYDRSVRPDCEDPITVTIGLGLRQIIELDEPKQILNLNAWVRLQWHDCQLEWNSSAYGGIRFLSVPYDKVWTPDITLYDSSSENGQGPLREYRATITDDGIVSYNFPYIISAMCKLDVTYFPFDTQRCPLQFGSWSYNGLQLDVTNKSEEGDLSSFVANSEFEITEVPVERHELYYSCCPEPYPDVTFYIILKRKPSFYVINLLFPCILITSVAALGFILPPDAGEKIGLEITVLLSLAVFQLVISEALPPSSESFPEIGVYFSCSMALVMFSTVLTVFVLNAHHKECKALPRWMRVVFLEILARVVCFETHRPAQQKGMIPASYSLPKSISHTNDDMNGRHNRLNKGLDYTHTNGGFRPAASPHGDDKDPEFPHSGLPLEHFDPPPATADSALSAAVVQLMREQLRLLKQADERREQKQEHDHQKSEWKKVATVLDRLFLILFVLVFGVTNLAVLIPLLRQ